MPAPMPNPDGTINPLDILRGKEISLFPEGAEMALTRNQEKLVSGLENQSNAFKALNAAITSVATGVTASEKRAGSKGAASNLKYIEKQLSNPELSEEEKTAASLMHDDLVKVNESMLSREHSMHAAFGGALKDNLPSLAGILGTIGLDNPAFLFIGSMMQTMMDKRRDAKRVQEELAKEHHKERLKLDFETLDGATEESSDIKKQTEDTGDIKDSVEESNELDVIRNTTLDHMLDISNMLLEEGQANKFSDIENQREQIRRDEALIDAVDGIEIQESGKVEEKKAGLLSMLGDFGDIVQAIVAGASFLAPALGAMVAAAAPFIVGLAAVAAVYVGLKGAFAGWDDAAEKLGKESATFTDKVASAIGGYFGAIAGVWDSIMGFFGVETDIGGFIDQNITVFLAKAFDWVKALGADIVGIFESVSNWFVPIKDDLVLFITDSIEQFPIKVKEFFASITDFALPKIEFFDEFVDTSVRKVLSVIDSIIDSIVEGFRNFSLKELVFGADIEKPEKIDPLDAINKNLFGKSVVEDWAAVQQMTADQIQQIMDLDDFTDETNKRLADLKKKALTKPIDISDNLSDAIKFEPTKAPIDIPMTEIQPREMQKDLSAQLMFKEAIDQERANNASAPSIVNAPTTSSINNVSNNTSVQHTTVSAHDNNSTVQIMNGIMAAH